MTTGSVSLPSFVASYTKLDRARKFITELEGVLAAYVANDPVYGRFRFDMMPPSLEINWKGTGEEPGAIIGDAIHNMRTALDLMASELARINNCNDRNVYFPFCENKDDLPEIIKKRNFHKAGEKAVDLLHKFAPYRGGNAALRGLHDLDVQDKHTSIIVMGRTLNIHVEASYALNHRNDDRLFVKAESIIFEFQGGPFNKRPVVETLKELVQLVDGILKAFAAL